MKKQMMIVLLLSVLCAFAIPAMGETRTYTYGGSGLDSLNSIAVSADNRIVLTGVTESSDGTLKGRTKSGQAGWVLCIDKGGNVLWNFCRHAAKYERMNTPVCHEDGSVTVLFWMEKSGFSELELIRLSAQGEMLSGKVIAKSTDKLMHVNARGYYPGEGYVIAWMDKRKGEMRFDLYDWDGNYVRTLEDYSGESPSSAIMMDGTRVSVREIEQNGRDAMVTFETIR